MPQTEQEIDARNAAAATYFPACGQGGASRFLSASEWYHGRRELYHLVRCPSCSLVWLENPPRPEEMGQHYGTDYDRSVAAAGADPSRWRGRRDASMRYKSGGSMLDLGCSPGGFLEAIKGPSWKLYCIETSHEVAAKASQPSISFRVIRKAFRLSLLPVLNGLASFAGDGETIHAIFAKERALKSRSVVS
jgi:hypothetical protein